MELDFAAPLLDRPGPWATVCVATGRPAEDTAARRELAARAARDELEAHGADRETREAVHRALTTPAPGGSPAGRVVYATAGQVVLDVPLARAPATDLVDFSALPRLTPLVELAAREPTCLLARVDRTGADFWLRSGTGAHAAGEVSGERWPVHRTASADWSEHHFDRSVEETWERNATVVAEELSRLWRRCGADVVVLAGDPRIRHEVRMRLPGPVRAVTTESEHGSRAAGSGDRGRLDHDVDRVRHDRVREHTLDVLERYRAERAKATGAGPAAAAEGVPALVEAAREHRIAALLIDPDGSDVAREVWVGTDPDQVSDRRTDSAYLGAVRPAPARADDALLRSAAATGAEVLRVDGAEAPAGGLGALLRWAEPAR
ncbi:MULTISPECIES: baeRF2 domain-containing protein [Streptomycetaceae]|uniref:Peptide chain release factor 1 n=1 Tax=Streptantibioticus cattleyicolor (strain ATCC 35852 / DSM 46488 / JCM 4925 / NBRC 14057 / NRRL 8057) TaxID=1003195 RepID=F8JYN0_STREN|nr:MULTISPECIES: Vms1/Ankzf1 family peptidyl-tRNA hydrolase [Streptomycetaceae]AEW97255.1 hypothetical protein SCATT_48840 [Streptantibioticus cattleyicolor NRRL 8057 = DSM 46488]MYS61708.1 hypothetical protein [Streptomyces sp. SID5468]CCB77576.1 conserved protein of unknown function [Streptantibioticus cattleyicolor NRRL 8057 = DSM 46488]